MSTLNEKTLALLSTPSLRELAYVLRHPQMWPKGFVWDYSNCRRCAMGMAFRMWFGDAPRELEKMTVGASEMARRFGIPYEAAAHIFFDAGSNRGWFKPDLSGSRVTPEMVATAIDKYLAQP